MAATIVNKDDNILQKSDPQKSEKEPNRCRVVTVDTETGKANSRRILFEGLEDDARQYVADNFPRPHIEGTSTPVPDVVLQTMNGDKVRGTQQFHATDGWSDYKEGDDK